MKKKRGKKSEFLNHDFHSFTEQRIGIVSKYFGIENKNILERHIWIYEVYSQIQKRLKNSCVLKGGACAQLYLPLEVQRCTEDLDIYTSLDPSKLKKELQFLAKDFNMSKIPVKIREYIPKSVRLYGKTMPITTIIINLPFIFKENRKRGSSELKIDFLYVDIKRLQKNFINNGEVLGLKLNYAPNCISLYSIIGAKLMVFAVNTIGIEGFKKDKLYKNIYDVYYLIENNNNIDTLKKVGDYIKHNIDIEFYVKGIEKVSLDNVLTDILKELYILSVEDIKEGYEGISKRVKKFEDNYIQKRISYKLTYDRWGIMASYIYIWVYALKKYIMNDECASLEDINHVFKEYEYYNTLSLKEQRDYLNNIINKLRVRKDLRYDFVEEPLRLIYLHNIIT
ncbi:MULTISPECIES: nucleotidyl transferase AbiEii/AbiGii toxin family protein [Clostridium]|jgi:DNA-binding Lrp family transcriptional regulator|uniref:Nucleotidyl transferase AbiEii toxin, Type IV TA system n=2 Tax=Clostridium TaxID=1485 RepID=A0A151AMY3_9CLOT|nr:MULTISPECIES: nucleotidyl transferase AbiEii/AbiGii toxin family protein [Clostridium]KYH28962.1 hypothetical protein CLCOL_14020 [Clostridium colicanis DSM 13634]MBE6044842.1 hypothetical protein [Clostridium thermopalmarium]PRR73236.1 hypothetical protein CPAL_13560 [Clostridium thermopalmarium DSM 5974]PVZ25200.1 nucleotidyltransferase AbiEii toxin of type IV toxin-antitoxin system [Clostridium thermopalmarium DSM 5974]